MKEEVEPFCDTEPASRARCRSSLMTKLKRLGYNVNTGDDDEDMDSSDYDDEDILLTKARFKRFSGLWDGMASDDASQEFNDKLTEQKSQHLDRRGVPRVWTEGNPTRKRRRRGGSRTIELIFGFAFTYVRCLFITLVFNGSNRCIGPGGDGAMTMAVIRAGSELNSGRVIGVTRIGANS